MSEEALRILMVEDQEADAILIQRELRRQGMTVVVRRVECDAAMIRALREFDPDLVLSDFALPGFSGLEALAILRKERPGVPLIFVSGTVVEEQAVELLKMGATDYVWKENLARLPVAINRALREVRLERERRRAEESCRTMLENSTGRVPVAVAHDLNNILAPIAMAASMLRTRLPDAERERMLTIIENSAKRASEIVRAALVQGRSEEGERQPLAMGRIIKAVFQKLPPTWPETLRVKLHVEDKLWPVAGDAAQIEQVILDLCLKAGDALPAGGMLRLSVANQELNADDDPSLPRDAKPGLYIVVEVSETRQGGQPEAVSRAFDPFFQNRTGGGDGMEMSTVQGIVSRHGGFVQAVRVPGEGTTTRIFLPATREEGRAVVPPTGASETGGRRAGSGECVLLVDDEETIRFAAKAVLTKHGYRVLTATDGADALKVYNAHAAEIALVLTDVMMPVMDGLALVRAVLQVNPAVRIIASSGQNERTRLAELRAAGVDTVLNKPYAADILLRTVSEVLGGRTA